MDTDKDNGQPKAPEPAPVRIVLTFAGPGSADVTMRAELVTPGQVYLAAWYLDAVARELRQGQLTQQALAGAIPEDVAKIARELMAGKLPTLGRQS